MKYMTSIIQGALLAVILLGGQSCMGDFDDINRNPNEVTDDQLKADGYIINTNLKGLQNLVIPTEEHLYQFCDILAAGAFAGYMESTPDIWKSKCSTFNPSEEWLLPPFSDVISKTYPYYRALLDKTDNAVALSLAKVFRVAIMQRVTDTYGPIPYSKIVENKKESLTVAYDSQEMAYTQMFKELDEAIAVFEANKGAVLFTKGDDVYFGKITQWVKFTNSLKLRLAMRLAYIKPDIAKAKAEEAVAGGVIEENADNARLTVEDNRAAMIFNKWEDHRAAADIICILKGYNDPRLPKMFTKGKWLVGEVETEDYVGIRVGTDSEDKAKMVKSYSNVVIADKDPYLWMNAAEVTFLRAEGALRGWSMQGSAQVLYEKAIGLSFEERKAGDTKAYIADETSLPADYVDPQNSENNIAALSKITIKWEDDATKFAANLERIITQKYIAIFPLSFEAWADHRRTGYPPLFPSKLDKSGGTVNTAIGIRRLMYPGKEYSDNPTHLPQAIASYLGGPDNGSTRVWWDVQSK